MKDFIWKIKLYLQKHEWKTLAPGEIKLKCFKHEWKTLALIKDILFACKSNEGFYLEDKIIFTKARVENTRARRENALSTIGKHSR